MTEQIEVGGISFFFQARLFNTERRSGAVYKQVELAIRSDLVSVYRFFDKTEDRWAVMALSEDSEELDKATALFPDGGHQYRPVDGLLTELVLRRIKIVADPEAPPEVRAHYGPGLEAGLEGGEIKFGKNPQG
jgi:hypothetical protein